MQAVSFLVMVIIFHLLLKYILFAYPCIHYYSCLIYGLVRISTMYKLRLKVKLIQVKYLEL